MVYFSGMENVQLKNGIILQNMDGMFPPLQDIAEVAYACEICPIRVFCGDNNEFDCQVYGMFAGFCFGVDDALGMATKYCRLVDAARLVDGINHEEIAG